MKLADFHIKNKLGAGGFGTAYLVTLKRDVNKRYVIKLQSSHLRKTFENEVSALMKLRHPNIIEFRHYWCEGGNNIILMEYATQGTLMDYLCRRARPLREEDALYFLSQIVLGVNYIHKKLVLHRDLKPANILLTGSRGIIVKIADFGISKDISRDLGRTIIGTQVYMAPEVFLGQTYGIKCDVWSIGVIFYEMLTKRLPFTTKNHLEMIRQICTGTPYRLPHGLVSPDCVALSKQLLITHQTFRPTTEAILKCSLVVSTIRRVYRNIDRIL